MFFSVIIPLYNKAPYVEKAVRSVLSQTFTDFELVIVDDGSQDDSAIIAAQAIEGRKNCRLFKQENAGVSVARNNGVAASHGDCLCFLDADDWWNPSFLEEMSNLVREFPDAGIYGTSYTIINETKHKTRVAKIGVEEGFEKGCINYCQAYAKTMYMPLWTGAVCIPRPVFERIGGFPKGIKLGEDFMLWIRIALKYKAVLLNRPLAYYNQDVDIANRGVGRLHDPKEHMLWNLTDLEPLEKTHADYKHLVDTLRTEEMMPYLLEKRYSKVARKELEKVDWNGQPASVQRLYRMPLWVLKLRAKCLCLGARVKQVMRLQK